MRAVETFHRAIRTGDAAAASAVLAPDAMIFEQGGVEQNRAQYMSGHFAEDAAYGKAVREEIVARQSHAEGSFAWVVTQGRATGAWAGKPVLRRTTETVILERIGGRWHITHIHWSSRAEPES